jgi:hypothetical protein
VMIEEIGGELIGNWREGEIGEEITDIWRD